jgi:hypothetical protein
MATISDLGGSTWGVYNQAVFIDKEMSIVHSRPTFNRYKCCHLTFCSDLIIFQLIMSQSF